MRADGAARRIHHRRCIAGVIGRCCAGLTCVRFGVLVARHVVPVLRHDVAVVAHLVRVTHGVAVLRNAVRVSSQLVRVPHLMRVVFCFACGQPARVCRRSIASTVNVGKVADRRC